MNSSAGVDVHRITRTESQVKWSVANKITFSCAQNVLALWEIKGVNTKKLNGIFLLTQINRSFSKSIQLVQTAVNRNIAHKVKGVLVLCWGLCIKFKHLLSANTKIHNNTIRTKYEYRETSKEMKGGKKTSEPEKWTSCTRFFCHFKNVITSWFMTISFLLIFIKQESTLTDKESRPTNDSASHWPLHKKQTGAVATNGPNMELESAAKNTMKPIKQSFSSWIWYEQGLTWQSCCELVGSLQSC